jgi:hypothetical protein
MTPKEKSSAIEEIKRIQNSEPVQTVAETQRIARLLPTWIQIAGIPHRSIADALDVRVVGVSRKLKNIDNFTLEEIKSLLKICLKYKF